MLDKEEIIELVDNFINEVGMWSKFVEWLEEQGYTPDEIGFPEDA